MDNIKNYRSNELKSYVIGNILVILLFSTNFLTPLTSASNTCKLSISYFSEGFYSILLSSIIYIYVFIFDSVVTAEIKYNICFVFRGLPAEKIFSELKCNSKDIRFTPEQVYNKYSEIYSKLDEINQSNCSKEIKKRKAMIFENSKWYKIYCKYKNNNIIIVANRDFLLCRDVCTATIFIGIIYFVLNLVDAINFNYFVPIFIIVEFLLSMLATVNKGKRLAYDVIALDLAYNSKKEDDLK